MGKYIASEENLKSIANAIRTKGRTSENLSFPDGFVGAIANIPTGGSATLITKNVTENGTYSAINDNADGYSSVSVAIPYLFKKIGTYTVQESWETGYTALTACQAILDGYLDSNASGYALVFNNNTVYSSYKVDMIILFTDATSIADLSNSKAILRTNSYARIADGIGGTIKASQGSVVDIYKLMKPT